MGNAIPDMPQVYEFRTPAEDLDQNPSTFPYSTVGANEPTFFPRLVGVDGREQGKLKRFPGYYTKANWTVPTTAVRYRYKDARTDAWSTETVTLVSPLGGYEGTTFFRYFAIQKDVRQDGILRGWLFLAHFLDANDSNLPVDCLVARYYDTDDAAWYTEVLTEFTTHYRIKGGICTDQATPAVGEVTIHSGMDSDYNDYAGAEISVYDSSSPTVESRTIGTPATDAGYAQFPVTSNFGFSPTHQDAWRIKRTMTPKYVTKIDVTSLGRHLYVVGEMAEHTTAINGESISRQIRCRSTYQTEVVTLPWGVNTGSHTYDIDCGNFHVIVDATTAAITHNNRVWRSKMTGWIAALDDGTNNQVRRCGESYFCLIARGDTAPYGTTSNLFLCLDRNVTARNPGGDIYVCPPKWVSGPIDPGRNTDSGSRDLFWAYDLASPSNSVAFGLAGGQSNIGTFASSGGKLSDGTVIIGYRLVAPEQNWYSSLSALQSVTLSSGTSTQSVSAQNPSSAYSIGVTPGPWHRNTTDVYHYWPMMWPPKWANVHTRKIIQLFRSTVGAVIPGTTTPSGVLFLEKEVEIEEGFITPTTLQWGTLADAALYLADTITPEEAGALQRNPASRLIQEYENLLFWVATPQDDDFAVDLDVIRWAPPGIARLNYIPVDNRRIMPDFSSRVQDMVKCGSFLAVVLDNEIIRIHRSGSNLAIDSVHNRYGAAAQGSAFGVGSFLYVPSAAGLLAVDLLNGTPEVMAAIAKKFWSSWRASLSSIRMNYDSKMGLLTVLNTTAKEAILVWMNQGIANELWYLPWDDVDTGADPETGGVLRGWFWEASSRTVYRYDSDEEAATQTMNGGAASIAYNHTVTQHATAGSRTTNFLVTVPDAAASDTALSALVGMPVVCVTATNAANKYVVRYVSAASRTTTTATITVGSAFPAAILTGDTFALAPIVMDVIMPPVTHDPSGAYMNQFYGKEMTSAAAKVQEYTAADGAPCNLLVYRVYDENLVELVSATKAVDMDPEDSHVSLPINGVVLLPGVACYAADCPFSLTSAIVYRTITASPVTY